MRFTCPGKKAASEIASQAAKVPVSIVKPLFKPCLYWPYDIEDNG